MCLCVLQANLGHLDKRETLTQLVVGNMALIQVTRTTDTGWDPVSVYACMHLYAPETCANLLAVLQGQALVVGASASAFALLLDWATGGTFCLLHALILPAAALVTASVASAALGLLMISVIVGSRCLGINPDNIATPIAASLGDIVTLSILAYTSKAIFSISQFNSE